MLKYFFSVYDCVNLTVGLMKNLTLKVGIMNGRRVKFTISLSRLMIANCQWCCVQALARILRKKIRSRRHHVGSELKFTFGSARARSHGKRAYIFNFHFLIRAQERKGESAWLRKRVCRHTHLAFREIKASCT